MTTRQKSGITAYSGSIIAVVGIVLGYLALPASGALNAPLLLAACVAFALGALLVSAGIVGIRRATQK